MKVVSPISRSDDEGSAAVTRAGVVALTAGAQLVALVETPVVDLIVGFETLFPTRDGEARTLQHWCHHSQLLKKFPSVIVLQRLHNQINNCCMILSH